MPASFVRGPDGERAWARAKEIVKEQYGDIEKADPDRFYALVTTVYKSVCRSEDYNCGPTEARSRMAHLSAALADAVAEPSAAVTEGGLAIKKARQSQWDWQEAMAKKLCDELKKKAVGRVTEHGGEVTVDLGMDGSIDFIAEGKVGAKEPDGFSFSADLRGEVKGNTAHDVANAIEKLKAAL